MSNQKTFSIYTLSCPKTGAVRYVGATSQNPKTRLAGHRIDAKRHNSAIAKWITSLLVDKLEPIMNIIDSADNDTWQEKERYWIQWHKDEGYELTNSSDGGVHCAFDEEICKKRSGENNPMYGTRGENSPNYGKKHSEESRKKMSEAQPNKRQVAQYTKNMIFIRNWDSISEASRELQIHQSSITQCCQRKPYKHKAGGYIWYYTDDPLLLKLENKD